MGYRVSPNIELHEKDMQFRFIHASGPGGQNVNKVATAVQLRFDVEAADLPSEIKARLKHITANQINQAGELIIDARRYRSQLKNKNDAVHRLIALVHQAMNRPKKRIPSKPSRKAIEKRLEQKQMQSRKKAFRKKFDHRSAFD